MSPTPGRIDNAAEDRTKRPLPLLATLDEAQDVLGGAIYEAMVQLSSAILPLPGEDAEQGAKPVKKSRRCAQLDGFSLHANTSASAESRIGLEKLCRYGLRPAFSVNRLSISDQGKVLYTLAIINWNNT